VNYIIHARGEASFFVKLISQVVLNMTIVIGIGMENQRVRKRGRGTVWARVSK
jgi:hypothetical protein